MSEEVHCRVWVTDIMGKAVQVSKGDLFLLRLQEVLDTARYRCCFSDFVKKLGNLQDASFS
jgi:hypothetical protein